MNRIRWPKLLILLALSGLGPACALAAAPKTHHVHKKDEKVAIDALETQWTQATLAGDLASMDKLLSPDYVGISMSGQVNTKQQQLDRLRKRTLQITALTISDSKIKIAGSVAIVTGLAQVDGTNDGENLKGEYRFTRIYQRLPSGLWQITNYEVTRIPKNRPNRPPGGAPPQDPPPAPRAK